MWGDHNTHKLSDVSIHVSQSVVSVTHVSDTHDALRLPGLAINYQTSQMASVDSA